MERESREVSRWLQPTREHLLTGVTYMIPFVTIAGVFLALGYTLGDSTTIGGNEGTIPWYLVTVGSLALGAMVPILGGFVAYGVADRPGLAPGFVLTALVTDARLIRSTGTLLGINTGDAEAGYIGALVVGLLAGFAARWATNREFPPAFRPLVSVLAIPVAVTGLLAPLVLVLGVPIALGASVIETFVRNATGMPLLAFGAVLGAMMAADLGGPINKVAYVFAVGLLPELLFTPMAAVMIAGMVPPIGFGIAHLLVPSRFPDVERQQARAAVIAGCSFVTEGALVYTADRGGRFDLSCVIGAAAAGAAAMSLGVSVPAPHGGVLVVPLTNSPANFLGSLSIGVAVTALASVVRGPAPQSTVVTEDG